MCPETISHVLRFRFYFYLFKIISPVLCLVILEVALHFEGLFAVWLFTQIHEYMSKRPHYQNAPTFTKTPHFLPKRPHLFIAKTAHLIIFSTQAKIPYMYHVWCLVIQDLSSKFIYCICISYIGRQRTCIYI
jgi:hypothetical protein